MCWKTEEEFVNDFVKYVKHNNHNKYTYKIYREMKTGYGRPDVVLVQYNPEIMSKSNAKNNNVLSKQAAYAIYFLSKRRWVKISTLVSFLRCRNGDFKKILEELKTKQLVEISKEDLIKSRPMSQILAINRIVVFEAKLKHLKEVVDQAERHLWFTNESYVVMPSNSFRNSYASILCKKRGVGLSLLDSEEGLKTIVRTTQKGYINSPYLWILNELIKEEN